MTLLGRNGKSSRPGVPAVPESGSREGRRRVGAGEYMVLPASRRHWHGAAPGQSMCHVSIRQPGSTDWEVERRDW
jgi:hypothetical protein